ncbi:hypothetical protein Baya_3114 [Bagarius yarrelli]|uniref:Uncharacterized protein n=1 Tax=Bagarius yarrelli TaxID=175774 RepID=A0A556TUG9_BAGYA|nr:hypothetical protein Baya_3114 [Bagarius yarrelli]
MLVDAVEENFASRKRLRKNLWPSYKNGLDVWEKNQQPDPQAVAPQSTLKARYHIKTAVVEYMEENKKEGSERGLC